MARRRVIGGAAVAAAGLLAAGLLLRADEPKAPPAVAAARAADFAGKVVFVQTRGGVRSATLENAAVRPLAGRPFLVGKALNDDTLTPRQFFTGAELWLPVEDIESLTVFDSLGQLKRNAGGQ
jgi:hypothetical protein